MKTNTKNFDLLWSQTENNTIDLAWMMWLPAMDPIDEPIRIKIEVDENHGKIFEIPVKIKREVHEVLAFETLEEMVEIWIASKQEFRFWNKIQKILKI